MSYQKRYLFTFRDDMNRAHRVEIWRNTTDVVVAEEITGGASPFVVTYPGIKSKLEPIVSSLCDLNLFSETDRQFDGLYTNDIFEYQIRHYINDVLNWLGFLDAEQFSSPFSEKDNYEVSFSGSDGFGLLDRINFVDSSDNLIYGLETMWNILKTILQKLTLPFDALYVNISTSFAEVTIGTTETLFHKLYNIQENYINEDGEAETCKTVLDTLLRDFELCIKQKGGALYIYDIHTLAQNSTVTFKKYNAQTFAYIGTADVNLSAGDLLNIGFVGDQHNDRVSGFNKQVIKYSPYKQTKIIDADQSTSFYGDSTYVDKGTTPFVWRETSFGYATLWNKSNNGKFCSSESLPLGSKNDEDNYLKIEKYTDDYTYADAIGYDPDGLMSIDATKLCFTYRLRLPILISSPFKLRISGRAFVKTTEEYNNPDAKTALVYYLFVRCKLKLYNQEDYPATDPRTGRSNDGVYGAHAGITYYTIKFWQQTGRNDSDNYSRAIDNEWIDLKSYAWNWKTEMVDTSDILVDLSKYPFLGKRAMEFEIFDWMAFGKDTTTGAVTQVIDVRLKDVAITLVDRWGRDITTNDIEFVGRMDARFKNEGSHVTLLLGTNTTMNPIQRGSILYYNDGYKFCQSFTRNGKTDKIENLLMRSIVGNYYQSFEQLTCKTNLIENVLGCVTYDKYFPGKVFMITGIKQDYESNESEATLQEVFEDSLTYQTT